MQLSSYSILKDKAHSINWKWEYPKVFHKKSDKLSQFKILCTGPKYDSNKMEPSTFQLESYKIIIINILNLMIIQLKRYFLEI